MSLSFFGFRPFYDFIKSLGNDVTKRMEEYKNTIDQIRKPLEILNAKLKDLEKNADDLSCLEVRTEEQQKKLDQLRIDIEAVKKAVSDLTLKCEEMLEINSENLNKHRATFEKLITQFHEKKFNTYMGPEAIPMDEIQITKKTKEL